MRHDHMVGVGGDGHLHGLLIQADERPLARTDEKWQAVELLLAHWRRRIVEHVGAGIAIRRKIERAVMIVAAHGESNGTLRRVLHVLHDYLPLTPTERRDIERIRQLVQAGDPWSRSLPLHVTGSGVIVHPSTRRVLL